MYRKFQYKVEEAYVNDSVITVSLSVPTNLNKVSTAGFKTRSYFKSNKKYGMQFFFST